MTQTIYINLYLDYWISIRFALLKIEKEYLINSICHVNRAKGTWVSCSYVVIKSNTSYILVINPTPYSVKLDCNSIVGIFKLFKGNTCYSFLNWETPFPKTIVKNLGLSILATQAAFILSFSSTSISEPSAVSAISGNVFIAADNVSPISGMVTPLESTISGIPTINSMPFADPPMSFDWWSTTDPLKQESSLSWHLDIIEPVDPFGPKDEFSQSRPIQPQPNDSDMQMDDLKWNICPGLNRQWKRK